MSNETATRHAGVLLRVMAVLTVGAFCLRALMPMTKPTSVVYLVLLLVLLAVNVVALSMARSRPSLATLSYLWVLLAVVAAMSVVDRWHGATDIPNIVWIPGLLGVLAWALLRPRLVILFEALGIALPLGVGWVYGRIGQAVPMTACIVIVATIVWVASRRAQENGQVEMFREMVRAIEADNDRLEQLEKHNAAAAEETR